MKLQKNYFPAFWGGRVLNAQGLLHWANVRHPSPWKCLEIIFALFWAFLGKNFFSAHNFFCLWSPFGIFLNFWVKKNYFFQKMFKTTKNAFWVIFGQKNFSTENPPASHAWGLVTHASCSLWSVCSLASHYQFHRGSLQRAFSERKQQKTDRKAKKRVTEPRAGCPPPRGPFSVGQLEIDEIG